jgi:ATP-dependent DNA helicase RecQ
MPTLDDALISLREHFGFDGFRAGQREVISAILERRDAVVVMPTGSGKSLCYQLPAMMLEGVTLVVSPLIALMKDQVDALRTRGLPATFINSSIDPTEQRTRIEALRRAQFKLVYVAPERFRSSRFVEALQSVGISLFAVDEAHCISTWGHDFRPDYLRLRSVIKSLGGVQTLALTATATPYVRSDIIEQLGLRKPQAFVSGFDRPNLSIDVVHTEKERQKIAQIKRLALAHEGSGIVYTSTRKAVEQVATELQGQGLRVAAYHAGMSDAVRIKAQDDFMAGRAQMIVATNAFGMGIDKPDIRFVAHYQMPGSIEAYYQEIGRAGRDGLPSSCVLLFNYADKNTHDFFIEGSYPTLEVIQDVYDALVATGLKRIELSTSEIAKRAVVGNEMAVQSSLYILERAGHLERGTLSSLDKAGVLQLRPARRTRGIVMLDSAPATKLRVNPNDIARRAALERRKLREILNFCYTDYCYRAHILDYFGDRHHARQCGTCGNCAPHTPARNTLAKGDLLSAGSASGRTGKAVSGLRVPISSRALTEDETMRVRKILACATRMRGRFGKHLLAATLRGSAQKNLMQAHLNELSTYGLLRDMRQDDILLYIDALLAARCLQVSPGEYPTISITELGGRVMRERARVELALPMTLGPSSSDPSVSASGATGKPGTPSKTIEETYVLYREGLSLEEIARQRKYTRATIESHLVDCVRAGFSVEVSRFVPDTDRALIERAIAEHGTKKLKPIHDSLPDSITYNMIRFVIADRRRLRKAAH